MSAVPPKAQNIAALRRSPACASFDHCRNFEIRGAAFRDTVLKLGGVILVTKAGNPAGQTARQVRYAAIADQIRIAVK